MHHASCIMHHTSYIIHSSFPHAFGGNPSLFVGWFTLPDKLVDTFISTVIIFRADQSGKIGVVPQTKHPLWFRLAGVGAGHASATKRQPILNHPIFVCSIYSARLHKCTVAQPSGPLFNISRKGGRFRPLGCLADPIELSRYLHLAPCDSLSWQ